MEGQETELRQIPKGILPEYKPPSLREWVYGNFLMVDWGQVIPLWVLAIALLIIALKI